MTARAMISALKSSLDSPRKSRPSRFSTASDVSQDSENWMAVGGALRTRGMTTSALQASRMSVESNGSVVHHGGLKRAQTAPSETLDSLMAENEALGERVFELEEQNRLLLSATRELEDLRAEVADHDHDSVTHVKTSRGSMKQNLARLELKLIQAEERCEEAERSAKAEEEAKEQLQQQLSDSEARHASTQEELARVAARLAEVQKQGADTLAELGSTKSTLEEVQQTLRYERTCLDEEREKVHKLEEEVDDLAASKAGQRMHGRKSRSDKRLVTHNLLSQLDMGALDDEDDEEEEEEDDDAEQSPEKEDSSAALAELQQQCEDLKKQLASASKEKEAAAVEAKALKDQVSSASREKEGALAAAEELRRQFHGACREKNGAATEAKDVQRRLESASKEKEAALAEIEELKRELGSTRQEREGVQAEMQATLDDLRRRLEHTRQERDEAIAYSEATRGSAATSSRQVAADQAALEAEHLELQQRLLTVERALELEQKTSRVLRAELHSPWWNRLTCFAKRPHHDGGDTLTAPEVASPQGPSALHLQMPQQRPVA